MKRISTATKVVDKFGVGKPGFTNGNAVTGVAATDLEGDWFDHVQEEISSVIEAAGGTVDGSSYSMLLAAIQKLIASISIKQYSITALPTVNVGPILVKEVCEVWAWSTSAYFTGYRSPLCGRPMDGHTVVPLASEIGAVGGTLSKATYAGLWGYAQENGLVLTQANWTTNIGGHYFVDVDAGNFRVPDLRNMFRRFTGTDADTAGARALGSQQLDALQNITGNFADLLGGVARGATGAFNMTSPGGAASITGSASTFANGVSFDFNASRVARTSTETRSRNTAYVPRIHI